MSHSPPRYIAPFHPKNLPHRFTDVLVIGGGLAGLRAAIEVDSRNSVLVVTKDLLGESTSRYAQGGIAGVLAPSDRFESHVDDTMKAGGVLCDRTTVEMVVQEAPRRIRELIDFGTRFDAHAGQLELTREGGHSSHRIVHALGDATGEEVMRAVNEKIRLLPYVDLLEQTFTLDLLTTEDRCCGALVCDPTGQKFLVWAKQTILCTGGAGQIFRESTNPPVATADGHAIAYRAGAELRDMEFMQFHPTVLYMAGSSRSLISEAVRGEGGHLLDRNGVRFMFDYDERGELAPRDVVSKAILTQMQKTEHPNVYLDLSHLEPEFVAKRFPGIRKACSKFGIDITHDRIPVRPGAHYMIGGVTVDQEGKTSLPGLWAAGEVACSGLHGANRLGSNSLLEGLVYGAHAGAGASDAALTMPNSYQALEIENAVRSEDHQQLDLTDIRNSLKSMMWRNAGVQRDAKGLQEAREMIETWTSYVLPQQFDDPFGWELQNLLTVAQVMVSAALRREESRGVHLRTDFPETNDRDWCRHVCIRGNELYLSQS